MPQPCPTLMPWIHAVLLQPSLLPALWLSWMTNGEMMTPYSHYAIALSPVTGRQVLTGQQHYLMMMMMTVKVSHDGCSSVAFQGVLTTPNRCYPASYMFGV